MLKILLHPLVKICSDGIDGIVGTAFFSSGNTHAGSNEIRTEIYFIQCTIQIFLNI